MRGTWSETGFCCGMMGLLPGPLLIVAADAGPDLYCGAVGGAAATHVEAEAGLATDDGAVCVEGPLLVRSAITVPDRHLAARRRSVVQHVKTLVAVDL
jgi:hypothetical protein